MDILMFVISLIVYVLILLACFFLFRWMSHSTQKKIQAGEEDEALLKEIEKEKAKSKKKRRGSKIVSLVGTIVLVLILVPTLVVGLIERVKENGVWFGDSMPLVIASGSMSYANEENTYLAENHLDNQFDTNDIIWLKKVDSSQNIALYDVIAYKNPDLNKTMVHRVIGLQRDGDEIQLTMRGDANNASDSYHPVFTDVVGRYEGKRVKKVGAIILFVQSPIGIATFVALIVMFQMLDFFSSKIAEEEEKRKEFLLSPKRVSPPVGGKPGSGVTLPSTATTPLSLDGKEKDETNRPEEKNHEN